MEEKVKLIFTDGTEIDAVQNASTYITKKRPDFPDDLTEITVEGENGTTVYRNAEIMEAYATDKRCWFGIKEITPAEQLRADVDYLLCLAE